MNNLDTYYHNESDWATHQAHLIGQRMARSYFYKSRLCFLIALTIMSVAYGWQLVSDAACNRQPLCVLQALLTKVSMSELATLLFVGIAMLLVISFFLYVQGRYLMKRYALK